METEILKNNSTISMYAELEAYQEIYGNQFPEIAGARIDALNVFRNTGIPTTKHEEWKYVNFSFLSKQSYKLQGQNSVFNLTAGDVEKYKLSANSFSVVVENGNFNINASNVTGLPKGLTIGTFSALGNDARVVKHLLNHADYKQEPFVAQNTAIFYDPIVIIADKNAVCPNDIQVIIISDAKEQALLIPIRILVIAEPGSEISILETYHSMESSAAVFVNAVSEVVIQENAKVNYIKLQNEELNVSHVNFHQVNMAKNSNHHITTISLGGSLVRNNLHIRLDDINCSTYLNGLYIADGNQLMDNHSLVDHAMPNCYSNELYKGIIGGDATGVFNGKIFVRKDAQKTNAYQSNKNILLSDNASMNAKPQLEIFADDVKCSHGATIGQIDEEALFYLRARGIGEASARALLNHAFAADVIDQIPDEQVKDKLLEIISEKLNAINN
jgi:Fe-S cluster assembly protein SufD